MTALSPTEPSASGSSERYAIYWAPPRDSSLARLGPVWLGRDADPDMSTRTLLPRPAIAGFTSEQLDTVTAEPRRYALHATLKPPFALAAGRSLETLCDDLDRFAAKQTPFLLPPLQLEPIGHRFLALIPSASCPTLDGLARGCVIGFDSYRRAASPSELARRRVNGLDAVEEENLQRWGYPYVLDRFRFHVTLTGALDASTLDRLQAPLTMLFMPAMAESIRVADIALFSESAPGQPFELVKRFYLGRERKGV